MPVSPSTILFAIRALVRVGSAAQKEIEASIRSRDAAVPRVLSVEMTPRDFLFDEILRAGRANDAAFIKIESDLAAGTAGAEDALYAFANDIGVSTDIVETAQENAGLLTIRQWNEEARSKHIPMARIGLAIVETALEYVAANPAVLGVGSNGERFVSAMANAINDILPDSGAENINTAESLFTERSLAIVMHAGLGALQDYSAEKIDEEHLRDLATSLIKPLHDHYDAARQTAGAVPIGRKSLVELRELMLGPMFQSGVNALARNQQAILGSRFRADGALGEATRTILEEIGQGSGTVRDIATRETWLRVYDSLLDLAIARPELIGGESDAADSAFGRDLVKSLAGRMKAMESLTAKNFVTAAAVESVDVLSRHTALVFGGTGAWDNVTRRAASSILVSVHEGLEAGLIAETGPGGEVLTAQDAILSRIFTEKQFGDLVRIVLDEAAKTPAMLTGQDARDEVKVLFAGIARAMSASDRNMLSGDDWLHLASVVASEAAKNPAKLFKMDGTAVEDQFAVRLVTDLLGAAAADFAARGRAGGSVMFGETLGTVMEETLRAAAENATRAAENQEHLIALLERLNTLHPGEIGRAAWLRMFRTYYKTVLFAEDGAQALAAISDDDLMKLVGDAD